MNAKNLPLKFGFVAVLIALALWGAFAKKLNLGIDLAGGYSLKFEIMTNQAEIAKLEDQQEGLKAQLARTEDANVRKDLEDQIAVLGPQIANLRQGLGDPGDLADEIISRLKERIDPHGFYNLEFRPLGKTRIEIRMPEADKESTGARQVYTDALNRLKAGNLARSEIYRVADSRGAERDVQIRALAGWDANRAAYRDPDRAELLTSYAEAVDAAATARREIDELEAAQEAASPATRPESNQPSTEERHSMALAALAAAQARANRLLSDLQRGNVNTAALANILHSHVSRRQMAAAADAKTTLEDRQEYYREGLKKLMEEHPGRRSEIQAVVTAYEAWAQARRRLDDPTDLIRLVRNAGVLEFRIAPEAGSGELTGDEVGRYKETLQDPTEGPESLRRRNDKFLWFPVHIGQDLHRELITSDAHGQTFVLLYNQPGWMMLQDRRAGGWVLTDARPSHDENARICVSFSFNPMGAKLFSELTGTHVNKPMAILLDDEVYSAPNIKEKISSSGTITGSFTDQEVKQLCNTLKAGSLPARINPEPVSQSHFGAAFGEVNLRSAVRAGWISAIVIVSFMLAYYMLCGAIANAALTMNMLLVIGAMGALDARFTLPGIAGVILVIGMAVDANVLIYERLREEQAKGQSIRMALKNAYERAFSAIFDSNITTLIVAAILGWVGTEEIRGFAITLGLGVAFNIFTAVWVTRWVFQVLLDLGWLNRPMRMLKVIGVPKIDWMGKRYYFWAFSVITLVLGLTAFFWQGRDILGIEFSGGTQAVLTFKPDALIDGKLPDDGLVRRRFAAAAAGDDRLSATARVEMVITDRVADFLKDHDINGDGKVTLQEWTSQGLSSEYFTQVAARAGRTDTLSEADLEKLPAKSYQISTTETDMALIQQRAAEAFGPALAQRQRIDFELEQKQSHPILKAELAGDGRTQITRSLAETAEPRYRADLLDAEGGVLLVARLKTPASQLDVIERIRDVSFQPDFSRVAENPISVIGLTPAEGDKYWEFAVVVTPADPTVSANPRAWDDLARQELNLLTEALHRREAMVAVNFDPPVAAQAQQLAIMAAVLAWLAIIVYLWVRFGQLRWGLAAVVCLVHDVTIILGMVAISGWLKVHMPGLCSVLGIDSFKIDLTMVAAILTVVGYSVNDTIVVFDRIRENRGKLVVVTPQTINNSINQTLSRTILTGITLLVVVVIMYVWGGQGIHAFNYALLVGVLIGTFSSIAVAAPMLLGFKEMMVGRAVAAPQPVGAAK